MTSDGLMKISKSSSFLAGKKIKIKMRASKKKKELRASNY